MGFTLNKLGGANVHQEMNAFRSAGSPSANAPKLLTKMGALFTKKPEYPVATKKKNTYTATDKGNRNFNKNTKSASLPTSTPIDKKYGKIEFFDQGTGPCAPIVSRISFSDDEIASRIGIDRPCVADGGKGKTRSGRRVQKGRAISDLARAFIPGVIGLSKDPKNGKGQLLKRTAEGSLSSSDSYVECNYGDLSFLDVKAQRPKIEISPSSVSPWDTSRECPKEPLKDSGDSEVFYDALPKTDSSWKSKKTRAVSSLTWSEVSSATSVFEVENTSKNTESRCKTSLGSYDHFENDRMWNSAAWPQSWCRQMTASDSFITVANEDVSPWFASRR